MSDQAFFSKQSQLLFEKCLKALLAFAAVTASGTHGVYGAANAAGVCTFTDATAATFTAAMVGQTITVSGSIDGGTNNGTFLVVGYTSATIISLYNPNGIVDSSVDVWAVVPNPTIQAGDVSQAYLTVTRVGTGYYCLTTTDGFPAGSFTALSVDLQPTVHNGAVIVQRGPAVQNVNGQHPFFPQVAVPLNSWSIVFETFYNGSALDQVPAAAVTGTHGVTATPAAGAQAIVLTDATAATFTPDMVGQSIVCSSGTFAGNNGTFLIVGYVNAQKVLIANPNAIVGDTTLHWSVTAAPTASVAVTFNNGPAQ